MPRGASTAATTEEPQAESLEPGAVNNVPQSPYEQMPLILGKDALLVGLQTNAARYSREGREMKKIDIRGKAAYDAKTLRDEAHKQGLVRVETDLKYVNFEQEFAVVKATVFFSDGTSFSDFGDASPASVPNSNIRPHFVRMATTRAISRALATALNADANSDDEFGGDAAPSNSSYAGRPSYRERSASSAPPPPTDEWS